MYNPRTYGEATAGWRDDMHKVSDLVHSAAVRIDRYRSFEDQFLGQLNDRLVWGLQLRMPRWEATMASFIIELPTVSAAFDHARERAIQRLDVVAADPSVSEFLDIVPPHTANWSVAHIVDAHMRDVIQASAWVREMADHFELCQEADEWMVRTQRGMHFGEHFLDRRTFRRKRVTVVFDVPEEDGQRIQAGNVMDLLDVLDTAANRATDAGVDPLVHLNVIDAPYPADGVRVAVAPDQPGVG